MIDLDRRIAFGLVRDTAAIVQRNLIAYRRVPQLVVFSTIQPVIFVVMFRYVFGGAVSAALPAGVDYVDFLMPGIFVQTVVFGAIATAIGLASDLKSGLMERFHALPMARSAVLSGRTIADTVRNVFVVALMMVVGFLVGWRVHTDVLGLLAGAGLVVLFGFSMSWIFATVGLAVGDPEAAQAAAFPVLAPLVFASSAFVPDRAHARVAPGLRRAPAGVGDGIGGAGPDPRRSGGGRRRGLDRLEREHHRGVRHDRGTPLPARGLGRARNRDEREGPAPRIPLAFLPYRDRGQSSLSTSSASSSEPRGPRVVVAGRPRPPRDPSRRRSEAHRRRSRCRNPSPRHPRNLGPRHRRSSVGPPPGPRASGPSSASSMAPSSVLDGAVVGVRDVETDRAAGVGDGVLHGSRQDVGVRQASHEGEDGHERRHHLGDSVSPSECSFASVARTPAPQVRGRC